MSARKAISAWFVGPVFVVVMEKSMLSVSKKCSMEYIAELETPFCRWFSQIIFVQEI